jgi:beta-lactamase class A
MPTPDGRQRTSGQKFKIAIGISLIPAFLASMFFFAAVTYAKTITPTTNLTAAKKQEPTAKPSPIKTDVLAATTTQSPSPTPKINNSLAQQELTAALKELTQNSDGTTYAITIVDPKEDITFGQNGDVQTHAASVMKTLVAAAVLTEIEKGNLAFNTPLGGSTVRNHLKRMINRSDNGSWDYFYQKLGTSSIQDFAQSIDMNDIKINGNLGTSNDFAHLLTLFYTDALINQENKKELFSYMQNTETENLLTLGIPEGVDFYHKTGKYNGGMHDAMIVDIPEHPYIIVVLSSNSRGYIRDRSPVFKEISKRVYEYFKSL